jgi:ABC-type amino acid transport system permease subunit
MESFFESVGNGLGNGIDWLAEHGVLFLVFAVLWIAFAVGVIWSQGTVDHAWQQIRDLPLLVQLVIWVLFLPVMIGMWVWQSGWPLLVRLVLVLGVAGWNLWMFLPRAIQSVKP